MSTIPFQTIDWSAIDKVEYKGEIGTAIWQTIQYPGLRIRLIEYSPGYKADHWCQKGHVVYCMEGDMDSELETGEHQLLTAGMMYVVSDNLSSHRSSTTKGVKLLIIDGDFLKESL